MARCRPGSSTDLGSDLPDKPGRAEDTNNLGVADPTGGPGAAFASGVTSRPVSCFDTTAQGMSYKR